MVVSGSALAAPYVEPETCGGDGQPACYISAAKYLGKVNPGGAFWDPRNGGEWWSCEGWRRTVFPVNGGKACETGSWPFSLKSKRAKLISSEKSMTSTGAFKDIGRQEWWRCPEGFTRNANPVHKGEACSATIGKACDSGLVDIRDPNQKGGGGFTCLKKNVCGKDGQRPCLLAERIPSCDKGLEENIRTVQCQIGASGDVSKNDEDKAGVWRWATDEPNNAFGGENCATQSSVPRSEGNAHGWNDLPCSGSGYSLPFACQNAKGDWAVTSSSSDQWAQGEAECNKLAPEGSYFFSVPTSAKDNLALTHKKPAGQTIWLNYTDQAQEGKWVTKDRWNTTIESGSVDSSSMKVGTGIGNITDPSIGLSMQGMADSRQTILGVEQNLYSRAFVIKQGHKSVVLVITDLWAGTSHVKQDVVLTLQKLGLPYQLDNVLISGTHNHSGMGGYTKNKMYEEATGGFQPSTYDIVVKGIVRSIVNAHDNLASGKIYINKGDIADVGRQRSMAAYNHNADKNQYTDSTNKEMVLLKFVQVRNGQEIPMGILNWYAIHPTDRGQKTRYINGDNKGWASYLFEQQMGTDYKAKTTFVAGFANSSAGDVSGNVVHGKRPDGINDMVNMKDHGQKQFDKALTLFMNATEELTGDIDYRYKYVDMSNVNIEGTTNRTWPAAHGLSFAAGSSEDSTPHPDILLNEGLTEGRLLPTEELGRDIARAGLEFTFGSTTDSNEFKKGHGKKPIIFAPGNMQPSIVPQKLPFQLIKIGQLVIVAGPGEFNTMAGRRLKSTVENALQGSGIRDVVLAGYANEYTQYITTKEEYDKQHYEGASTLFGPYTLQAYQQEYRKLANALMAGAAVNWAPYLPPATAPEAVRIIIRNESASNKTLWFYRKDDRICSVAFQELPVSANKQYAYSLKDRLGFELRTVKVRSYAANIWNGCKDANKIDIGQMLTIRPNGTTSIGAFEYQHPAQTRGSYTPPIGHQ